MLFFISGLSFNAWAQAIGNRNLASYLQKYFYFVIIYNLYFNYFHNFSGRNCTKQPLVSFITNDSLGVNIINEKTINFLTMPFFAYKMSAIFQIEKCRIKNSPGSKR